MPSNTSTLTSNDARIAKRTSTQSQPRLNLAVTKATPSKRRNEEPQTNAKKQRTQPSANANGRSIAQKNHRVISTGDESDESGEDDGFEPAVRKSSSRSTLGNDNGDDELEELEQEERILKDGPEAQTSKPAKTGAAKNPSEKALDRTSTISADTRVTFDKLAIQCRLVYLARFKLVPHATIIRAVWGDGITKQDWEWEESNNRVSWNGSNWKTRSIQNMQARIRDYIKNDSSNTLESISEYTPLAKFFASKYSPSAFSWVFDFTNGCIDITESDENAALHFYFKNIWINFATRVKLYMDWSADPQALHNSPHSRHSLLAWVPVMAKSDKYHVDIKHFVRVESRERRHRNDSAGPVEPDDDDNYLFLGTPPPE